MELRNLVTVGELIMSSALQRRESRGTHSCVEYPEVRRRLPGTVYRIMLRRGPRAEPMVPAAWGAACFYMLE